MKPTRLSRLAAALIFPAALAFTQCGKKETPGASAGSAPGSPSTPAASPVSALIAQADKLGFAGKLPQDTEFYFGSAGFKGHLDSLKKTNFYKQASAMIGDKTPAPTAGDKQAAAWKSLLGDDFFMAGGKGFDHFSAWVREFNRFYNEMNFRAIMAGQTMKGTPGPSGAAGAQAAGAAFATNFIKILMDDPAQVDRAAKVVGGLDLPPLLAGFKVANAAEVVGNLIPADTLANAPKDIFTISTMKVPGGSLQTITTEGGKILKDETKAGLLQNLPPSFNDQARKSVEKALTDFQGKKFAVAWGAVGDSVIFAIGNNLDHVKFADSPATSLLSKPEVAHLAPYVAKDVLGVMFADAAVLNNLADDQPITPMLRGVIGAMKQNPVFSGLGTALDSQMASYVPAEQAVFKQDFTSSSTVLWWDHGVSAESFGGAKAHSFTNGVPLKFNSLLSQPGVIFAMDYQRNKGFEQTVSVWSEKLLGLVYTAAQQLVQNGLGGPSSAQSMTMFDQIVLPALKKIYQADKDLRDQGLGGEAAMLLDVNGKMPALPGVPPQFKDAPFPRITTFAEVANRGEIAKSWTTINSVISETIGAFTGGGPGASAPGAGMGLPDPISSDKNGVTSYFFGLPFLAGDLLPCASINDHLFMLSTSKTAAEAFAAELAKPVATKTDGLIFKLDISALADVAIGYAKLDPKSNPKEQKEMREVQKWLKPFHSMQGRLFEDGGAPRSSFSWEITDLVSFD